MSLEKRRQRNTPPKSRAAIESARGPRDNSDFIPYPRNKIVGIIDDVRDAQAALHDLRAAGFTPDQITVLTGSEGAHRIDVRGDQHGPLARVVRTTQKALGDYELKDASRYEQEMLAGHFGIGVTAPYRQDRDEALRILKSHHGHFINFYSPWTIKKLEP